jgi:hypothetical protein
VTSANTTHSTKILAVNCKQLSSDIIDPLFLWYLWVGSVKAEPQWEKYPNLSVRSFVTSKKPILRFYFVAKTVHIYVAFLLALITLWARAYPRDVLATCCRHTCQGRGE